jgi:hypothetical protein
MFYGLYALASTFYLPSLIQSNSIVSILVIKQVSHREYVKRHIPLPDGSARRRKLPIRKLWLARASGANVGPWPKKSLP